MNQLSDNETFACLGIFKEKIFTMVRKEFRH